jgi:glycosyltransferase involved in cell wall biosynthesis
MILNWRDRWHPEHGGSEFYVQQVADHLAESGRRVTILTAHYAGSRTDEVVDGIRYVRRGGHLTVYLWAALLLLAGRLGPLGRVDEVIEVQNGMPFLARLFTRAPVVVLVHHVHREQWPVVGPVLARIGWFMESRAAVRVNRGTRYVAVSEVTRSELVSLGVHPSSVSVAYNALPQVPQFERRPPSPTPHLVVLSRLVPHKRIEHALRVVADLRAEIPDLHLTVMGSGWWESKLLARRDELGIESHVQFLGHVEDSTKFEVLSSAWVHLLPSVKEGWGLSIVEAARVGVPSVAYRSAGGVQESILDGVTGLLASNQEELVSCVRRLVTDHALRQTMGQKAEVRSEQFTWRDAATVMADALQGERLRTVRGVGATGRRRQPGRR